nr:hypothetical protein [Tanacetum cinerariifolium]
MFMRLFRSDDKFYQMLMQLESQPKYGGGSGSGGCGDNEPGDDEDGGEDEEDEDDSQSCSQKGTSASQHYAYTREQILAMEKAILGQLGWYITVPTPYVFTVRYTKALIPYDNNEMENMVFFYTQLGLMEYTTLDEAIQMALKMALKVELTISKGKSNSKFYNKLDLNQSAEKTQPLNSNKAKKNKSTYASTSSQTTKKTINQIGWIKAVGEVRVTKQCEVLISMGDNKIMKNVPPKLHDLFFEFKNIMPDELSDGLPPLRDTQQQINFIPRASLPNLPHYHMSPTEQDILLGMVEELLRKGVIQESKSPCAVPTLLVPKKDKTVYHQLRIRLGDEWKTAFKTKESFTSGFNIEDEHLDHLLEVLKVLQEHQLFVNLKKCSFMTYKLILLGFVVSVDGIHVDDEKIKVIQEWPTALWRMCSTIILADIPEAVVL